MNRTRARLAISCGALAWLAGAGCAFQPAAVSREPPPQPPKLRAFSERLEAYLEIRRDVAARLDGSEKAETPEGIEKRRRALVAGLREARKGARQGEIFTPAVTSYFRAAVRAELITRQPGETAAVLAEAPRESLNVNDQYPPGAALATVPPLLLARLPVLPDELQYRLLKRDLILLDCDAALVVDLIPRLLPGAGG